MGLVEAKCLSLSQSVRPNGGINASIGQAGSGAEGGSPEENQELFSELEEGKGSTLRNESRKQECIYFPCQKGVGARDGDHSQKNPNNFRSLVAIFLFSSHWFSCYCWKVSQEERRAGRTEG